MICPKFEILGGPPLPKFYLSDALAISEQSPQRAESSHELCSLIVQITRNPAFLCFVVEMILLREAHDNVSFAMAGSEGSAIIYRLSCAKITARRIRISAGLSRVSSRTPNIAHTPGNFVPINVMFFSVSVAIGFLMLECVHQRARDLEQWLSHMVPSFGPAFLPFSSANL